MTTWWASASPKGSPADRYPNIAFGGWALDPLAFGHSFSGDTYSLWGAARDLSQV